MTSVSHPLASTHPPIPPLSPTYLLPYTSWLCSRHPLTLCNLSLTPPYTPHNNPVCSATHPLLPLASLSTHTGHTHAPKPSSATSPPASLLPEGRPLHYLTAFCLFHAHSTSIRHQLYYRLLLVTHIPPYTRTFLHTTHVASTLLPPSASS